MLVGYSKMFDLHKHGAKKRHHNTWESRHEEKTCFLTHTKIIHKCKLFYQFRMKEIENDGPDRWMDTIMKQLYQHYGTMQP